MKFSKILFVIAILIALLSSACYINKDVGTSQVGIQLNKNAIVTIVPAGVYTDMGWFSDLRTMDINTMTFTVEDPEVMTKDNQAVGLVVTIQARRKNDSDSVRNIMTNWATLVNNDVLISTISATAREGMKNGTRQYTLTQLMDDRNGLATAIGSQLSADSEKYSAEIINVTIENIVIDPDYMAMLEQKALLRAETEKEVQRQELIRQQASNDILQAQQTTEIIKEQTIQAEAQTALEVEIASREGKKIAEANAVYKLNEQAFQLEQLRLMKEIFGDKTVFYIPEGTTLYQFLNTLGGNSSTPVIVDGQ